MQQTGKFVFYSSLSFHDRIIISIVKVYSIKFFDGLSLNYKKI